MATMFVMTHKQFVEPDLKNYISLHVGRAGSIDLGYQGDDTGDSISQLNCFYGELTGLYWIWKNYTGQENIGICHYRRFFVDNNEQIITSEKIDSILSEYDIITSSAIWTGGEPYWKVYGEAHDITDLEETGRILKKLYPDDYKIFSEVMNGDKYYIGNLMVSSRKLFHEYCSWLFSIFVELQEKIDFKKYEDAYHRRVFGFLSEQLLKVWVTARNLRVYECDVIIRDEKAETKELKSAVSLMMKRGQIKEARELFYQVIKVRPDVKLEQSDIKNEMFIIEQILYICELEQEMKLDGMLAYSDDLQELIAYFREIKDAIRKHDDDYKKHNITEIAKQVIINNI